jgi:hypothetical protein
MRYSEMTDEQRALLIDNPANYPLKIRFLGKTGIVSPPVVELLRANGIDFELDPQQIAELIADSTESRNQNTESEPI